MYTALRATSHTLTGLLEQGLHSDTVLGPLFDPAQGGTMVVSLLTPQELADSGDAGLSVWLYRVVRDDQQLNALPRRVALDRLEPPPLPLRLYYLVTPIVDTQEGSVPELEQAILGKVLQTFHDSPIVEGAQLRDDLADSDESIRIRLEPQGLEEITRVWDALERSYQLCVSYEVSLVRVASACPDHQISAVDSVSSELGTAAEVTS